VVLGRSNRVADYGSRDEANPRAAPRAVSRNVSQLQSVEVPESDSQCVAPVAAIHIHPQAVGCRRENATCDALEAVSYRGEAYALPDRKSFLSQESPKPAGHDYQAKHSGLDHREGSRLGVKLPSRTPPS